MPGCAAIGCNNRSEKGYTMKCFPRDPVLRQIWKDRVGRADWEPSNNSFLCHAHFAASQWMVTNCGRLKLRKGAIPSIFKVVTTRKSPNKRKRIGADGKSEDDECEVEIVDDDEEHYVYMESPGVIQNVGDESIVYLDSTNSSILQNIKEKDGNSENNVYQFITSGPLVNLQHENLIMISDENNQEIGSFMNNGSNYIIINNENEDTTNHLQPIEILTNQTPLNSRIKIEIKDEMEDRATTDDIYDEVENNMLRIYEGINTDDESAKQHSSKLRVYKNKSLAMTRRISSTNGLSSESDCQKNDATFNGQMILNDTIACLENSDDNSQSPSINHSIKNGDLLTEGTDDEVNFEAALQQRSKKVREEIMKTIESDFSGINSNNLNQYKQKRKDNFTTKVSGGIGNMSDITRNFGSKPSFKCSSEENKNQGRSYGNSCITSIIRVENSLPKMIKTEKISDSRISDSDNLINYNENFDLKEERIVISSESELNEADFQDENQDQNEYLDHNQDQEIQEVHQDDHEVQTFHQDQNNYPDTLKRGVKRTRLFSEECKFDSAGSYRDLALKIEQQQGVILKLTEQLSAYKGMEMKVTEVSDELKLKNKEISIISSKLNRKESTQGRSERNAATMQELIKDLTNKVKTLEDVNRRLSRSLSMENQNKKNLEYQVKSREKTIKELNWKVGKASKLLERAEKNATTYKRRMNNMQALMRRRHVDMIERQTPFDILFSDYAKHEFTEDSLKMALEIRKMCGSDGYEKLLNYNFPLPSQRTLRRKYHKDSIFTCQSNEATDPLVLSNVDFTNIGRSNFKNVACAINEKNSQDSSETVTGTVQDIFNEIDDSELMNENEVLSEKELKEQLFKFMNVNF